MKTIQAKTAIICAVVATLLTMYVLLIASAEAVCYVFPDWWRNEYDKYQVTRFVNGEMSLDDAVHVTEEMLEYCIGNKDTLTDVTATIDGQTVPFFTDRELIHLSDCRELFGKALHLRNICIIAAVILLLIIFVTRKKSPPVSITLSRGYLIGAGITFLITIALAVFAIVDFNRLFTEFHHVFFDNDFWILDPRKDNLINIMQERVFEDAAYTIGITWLVIIIVLVLISIHLLRSQRSNSTAADCSHR